MLGNAAENRIIVHSEPWGLAASWVGSRQPVFGAAEGRARPVRAVATAAKLAMYLEPRLLAVLAVVSGNQIIVHSVAGADPYRAESLQSG